MAGTHHFQQCCSMLTAIRAASACTASPSNCRLCMSERDHLRQCDHHAVEKYARLIHVWGCHRRTKDFQILGCARKASAVSKRSCRTSLRHQAESCAATAALVHGKRASCQHQPPTSHSRPCNNMCRNHGIPAQAHQATWRMAACTSSCRTQCYSGGRNVSPGTGDTPMWCTKKKAGPG